MKRPKNPAEPGNLRALKHGVNSLRILEPHVMKKVEELKQMIKAEATWIENPDRILLELLARNLVKLDLLDLYLAENGLLQADGKPQACLSIYWCALNAAQRACEQLGLSPSARAKLKLEKPVFDFAAAMQTVNVEEAEDEQNPAR